MTTITITIPDPIAPRVINAFCARFSYQPTIVNADEVIVPNPETKAQFAKRMLAKFIKDTVIKFEAEQAALAAQSAANTEIIIS